MKFRNNIFKELRENIFRGIRRMMRCKLETLAELR